MREEDNKTKQLGKCDKLIKKFYTNQAKPVHEKKILVENIER